MTEAAEIHLQLTLGRGKRQRRRFDIAQVRDRPDVAIDSNGVDENDGRVGMLLLRLDPDQAVVAAKPERAVPVPEADSGLRRQKHRPRS